MTVLSQDAREQWSDAGRLAQLAVARALFAVGWLLAKTLRLAATFIGAALFAVGWVAAAVAWPAACWCGRAVRLGCEQGARPAAL